MTTRRIYIWSLSLLRQQQGRTRGATTLGVNRRKAETTTRKEPGMHISEPAEVSPGTTVGPSPVLAMSSRSLHTINSSSSIELRTPPISLIEDVTSSHQNSSSSHHLQDLTSERNSSPTILGLRSRRIYDATCALPHDAKGMNSAGSWGKARTQRQRVGGHDFIETTRPGIDKDGPNAVLSKAIAELLHSCLLLKVRTSNKCEHCASSYFTSHSPSSTTNDI